MVTHKHPPALLAAIREIAQDETKRTGEKVSDAVVIHTLITERGPFYGAMRKRLKQRERQLNKEQASATTGRNTTR